MSLSNFKNFPKNLKKLVSHEIPVMSYVEKITDSDTISIFLDRRFYDSSLKRLRIRGIWAEENGTEGGDRATEFLTKILPVGTPVVVTTFKMTYDRFEADVQFEYKGKIRDLGDVIVENGFATREKPA